MPRPNGWSVELQAMVRRAKLPHLDAWNDRRRAHARRYNELLQGRPVVTPAVRPGNELVYHLCVIRAPQRDAQRREALQAWLKERRFASDLLRRQSLKLRVFPGRARFE